MHENLKKMMMPVMALLFVLGLAFSAGATSNLLDETGLTVDNLFSSYIAPTTINASVSFVDRWGTRPYTMLARQDCHVKEDGSGDSTTVQGCCDIAPWNQPFPFTIYVHNSSSGGGDGIFEEDVKCHAAATGQKSRRDEAGDPWESNNFVLRSNTENPTRCEVWVRSIHMDMVGNGMSPTVSGICLYGQTPFDDENSSLSVYGGGTYSISIPGFANGSRAVNASINGTAFDGVQCYDAKCYFAGNNFSFTHYGAKSKYNAQLINGNTANTGSPGALCFYLAGGTGKFDRTLDTCQGGNGYVDVTGTAMAFVYENIAGEGARSMLYPLDGTMRSRLIIGDNAPYLLLLDLMNTAAASLQFKTNASNGENYSMGMTSDAFYLMRTGAGNRAWAYDDDDELCFWHGTECDEEFEVNRSAQFEQFVEFEDNVNFTANITAPVNIVDPTTSSLLRLERPGDSSHQMELGPSTDDVNIRSRNGEFFASINNDATWFLQTGGGSVCINDGYNQCDGHTNDEFFVQGESELNGSVYITSTGARGLTINRLDSTIEDLCFGEEANNDVCFRGRGTDAYIGTDNFAYYPFQSVNDRVCLNTPYNTCSTRTSENFYVHGSSELNGTVEITSASSSTLISVDRLNNDIDDICFGPKGDNNICLRARGEQFLMGINNFAVYPIHATNAGKVCLGSQAYNTCAGTPEQVYLNATDVGIEGELRIGGVSGSGKVVCVKADGDLGTCSDQPGAGGTCTCA